MTPQEIQQSMESFHQYGDEVAFARLMEVFGKRLLAFISSQSNTADRDDIYQDTILRFAAYLRQQIPTDPLAFLFTTARNRLIDYHRSHKRASLVALEEGDDMVTRKDPMKETANTQLTREMLIHSGVSENQRHALVLHYWLGYSIPQIGELSDLSPDTVKSQLFLAKRKIKRYLSARKVS